ncbi:type IV pilin [Haloterrigena salifodinae]|uniref:Type IV pilin N-terminal domain-containing protein n=1 Tax=Haloterrigena salifodinae TaxID=2675099 RepID=A0A8T8DZU4_9EURY|nr:type IV pilin N-terminal domain-containing protein [Haloterrigena salifodinae]QRV14716.1 type IV pilin N-terminal domain-containing protein [Haloterrigena salifodinae]
MDLSKYRAKLVGNEEERAVSPVIGVILMVAITVILAAVIAAFVLDMGDSMGSGPTNAAVSSDVSNSDETVTLTVDEIGDAEKFEIRGEGADAVGNLSDSDLESTGDSVTLDITNGSKSGYNESSANIVAISGDSESTVSSFEWNFN